MDNPISPQKSPYKVKDIHGVLAAFQISNRFVIVLIKKKESLDLSSILPKKQKKFTFVDAK